MNIHEFDARSIKSNQYFVDCRYAFFNTIFGPALIASNDLGIMYFGFPQENDLPALLNALKRQWGLSSWNVDDNLALMGIAILENNIQPDAIVLVGTDWQRSVWNALITIPKGQVCTYSAIASSIGSPKAYRAVGTAVGNNPLSYIIPCHRVIPASGGFGQYLWGEALKEALLVEEGIMLDKMQTQ